MGDPGILCDFGYLLAGIIGFAIGVFVESRDQSSNGENQIDDNVVRIDRSTPRDSR